MKQLVSILCLFVFSLEVLVVSSPVDVFVHAAPAVAKSPSARLTVERAKPEVLLCSTSSLEAATNDPLNKQICRPVNFGSKRSPSSHAPFGQGNHAPQHAAILVAAACLPMPKRFSAFDSIDAHLYDFEFFPDLSRPPSSAHA